MISPSFQCDITSYSTWYHFAVQTRWYHFEKLGDITYLSRWYHVESYVISPIFSKWYHLLSKLCDITLIIKWYHLVQLVISLSSKVISHNNQGDITSKARWYHILLINSKTAPHRNLFQCMIIQCVMMFSRRFAAWYDHKVTFSGVEPHTPLMGPIFKVTEIVL